MRRALDRNIYPLHWSVYGIHGKPCQIFLTIIQAGASVFPSPRTKRTSAPLPCDEDLPNSLPSPRPGDHLPLLRPPSRLDLVQRRERYDRLPSLPDLSKTLRRIQTGPKSPTGRHLILEETLSFGFFGFGEREGCGGFSVEEEGGT